MAKRTEKKTRKKRGSRVIGYGRVSGGHRKSGQRGGKGRAGTYKQNQMQRIKEGFRETHRGFTRHSAPQILRATNLNQLDAKINRLLTEGALKKEGDMVKLDAKTLGIDKILGTGQITNPLSVTVRFITDKARAKIEAAGGEVIIA